LTASLAARCALTESRARATESRALTGATCAWCGWAASSGAAGDAVGYGSKAVAPAAAKESATRRVKDVKAEAAVPGMPSAAVKVIRIPAFSPTNSSIPFATDEVPSRHHRINCAICFARAATPRLRDSATPATPRAGSGPHAPCGIVGFPVSITTTRPIGVSDATASA
jgi:hypothetical protein